MNVKETAKVWGIKPYKVLQYIRDGLVPTAELVNAAKEDYEIPDGTPRPPCFRGPAVTMLENIDAIREEGANPYVRGFSYPEVVECYSFFLDCGGYERAEEGIECCAEVLQHHPERACFPCRETGSGERKAEKTETGRTGPGRKTECESGTSRIRCRIQKQESVFGDED